MFEWIKEHIIIVAFGILLAITGIPFFIHILFKLHPTNNFFIAEWTAGEVLSYYGSVLSFTGTVVLGALALWQNNRIKEESDKRTALLEQLDMIKNMPKFSFSHKVSNGRRMHLNFEIKNISENIASELIVSNIRIVDENENIFWSDSSKYNCDILTNEKPFLIALQNPPLEKDGLIFRFRISCKDKFEAEHLYDVVGKCETLDSFPNFKVVEISK